MQNELKDPRTWETQYQMIMALAESGYKEALPTLNELATKNLEHTMVLLAAGDALVRLGRTHEEDTKPVLELLLTDNKALIEGGLRAIAMLRLKLDEPTVRKIIEYVSRPENERLRFWVVAAAAGWSGHTVDAFLRLCSSASLEDTRTAAESTVGNQSMFRT